MSEMINAYAVYLRAKGAQPNTIDCRSRVLRKLHNDLPWGLAYASTDELIEWLQRDPTWSGWTRHTYAGHVHGFYGWAVGRWLEGNPAHDVPVPPSPDCVPRPVTDTQFQTAIQGSDDLWRLAILLAAYAGLRCEEMCLLARDDVTERGIYIPRQKGGSPGFVDIHPLLWELIEPRPPGRLLVRPNGRPCYVHWFGTNQRKHFDRLGLQGVTLHRFRHWFGTTLLDETDNLRVVQEALRHRHVSSTQIYTKVAGKQRRLAIRSLPTRHLDHPAGNQAS